MNSYQLTELKAFLSSRFHEDWALDLSDPEDVIEEFLESNPSPDSVAQIVGQIQSFTEGKEDQTIERELLTELGCYYAPGADNLGARDWLDHVASRLRGAIGS
jgi:hypothetical protein